MKRTVVVALAFFGLLTLGASDSCEERSSKPVSDSGIEKTSVQIPTGSDGLTMEQRNVKDRLIEDNKPGAIKHLYVVSAYSGQVIVYSTVRGKVSSGGKRLSPPTLAKVGGTYDAYYPDRIQDDGTYGSSMDYLFWWDTRGIYHQHYVSGGQIVHVSSQPLAVKGVLINMALEQ